MVSHEEAAAIATLVGAGIAVLGVLYKTFTFVRKFQNCQEEVKESIKIIKAEVTPNGGSSLKDTVNKLSKTCDRIEIRQKILDQRSKASLHYNEEALFETDKHGRLTWCNEKFQEITFDNGDILDGLDWISIIDDSMRDKFLTEFTSCLKMCRKLDIETLSACGRPIRFVGFPYRVTKTTHDGFLINCIFDGSPNLTSTTTGE
jgi:hypothetical protein